MEGILMPDSQVWARVLHSDPSIVVLEGRTNEHHNIAIQNLLMRLKEYGVRRTRLDITDLVRDETFADLVEWLAESFSSLEVCRAPERGRAFYVCDRIDRVCRRSYCDVCENASEPTWHMASFSVPAEPAACQMIRTRIDRMAGRLPFSQTERDDIMIATGEAVANAVKHGCPYADWKFVGVHCVTDGDSITVEISDRGPGFDLASIRPVGLEEERGRGIELMRTTMSAVEYCFDGGTTVRLLKQVSPK